MNIQVFSPHFDDASLSCGEHILRWRKARHHVEVTTVFTEFEARRLSGDSQDFMEKSGSSSAAAFRKQRLEEDGLSMKLLKASDVRLMPFTDGGFREQQGAPTYETHALLFAGQILDAPVWQSLLKEELERVIKSDSIVVVPLGVGQHADHLLVKRLISMLVPKKRLLFYVDIPYSLKLGNWSWSQIAQFVTQPKSLFWSSAAKIAAVNAYTSQVPLLFQDGIWQYPECVVGQAIHELTAAKA